MGTAFNNTVTKACLEDPKVHKTLGDGDDEEKYNAIQLGNDLAVWALKEGGYNADSMIGTLKRSKAPDPLTRPQSMERVRMLANATTHGNKHLITGGAHLMNNDMFLAAASREKEFTLKQMKQEKKSRILKYNTQQKALAILVKNSLEYQAECEYTCLNAEDLGTLIRFHGQIPKGDKQQKLLMWKEICAAGTKPPPECFQWTDEEEAQLLKLETEEVCMADTLLYRQQETLKRELLIIGANMTVEEWSAFCEKRQKKIDEMNGIPTETVKEVSLSVVGGGKEAV